VTFKIHNLHFKSPDPAKTAQWYIDNLGATMVRKVERAGGMVGFRLDLHGVPLNITGIVPWQELEQFYGLEHIGLHTDDLASVIEQAKASGSRILEELMTPDGEPCCFIEGPEGVRIEVTEVERWLS
jgi:catechol 2,3-dioxygenase-like lactoylglutathione lyase family enzyme